jgi:hypothetical protein
MMRSIAERTLEIDEELCVCLIDWQKAFDRVNWTNKEETVLQGMIDRLIEIGRCYGMEMNVEKTKVMRQFFTTLLLIPAGQV